MGNLKKGCTGQDVRNLQIALNYQLPEAFPPLVIDGIFGPKTKARTIEFQKQNDLLVDGVVGAETHGGLYTFVRSVHHVVIVKRPMKQDASFSPGMVGSPFEPPRRRPFHFPAAPLRLPQFGKLSGLIDSISKNIKVAGETGYEASFQHDPRKHETESEIAFVSNATATLWTRPIRDKLLLGLGNGFAYSQVLKLHGEHELSYNVFGRLQLIDLFKESKPFDLPLLAELRMSLPFGHPPTFSALLGAGPEITLLRGLLTIGVGGWFQYKYGEHRHTLSFITGGSLGLHF